MPDLQLARQSLVFSGLLGAAMSVSTPPLAPALVFLQLEGMSQGSISCRKGVCKQQH